MHIAVFSFLCSSYHRYPVVGTTLTPCTKYCLTAVEIAAFFNNNKK